MPPARFREKRVRKRLALGLVGVAALCGAWAAAPGLSTGEQPVRPAATAILARAVPLDRDDPTRSSVGSLTYLGGLHVQSEAKGFGGYSGLRWLPDGRMLAISDRGHWLAFRTVEAGGRLAGVKDAVSGPLLGESGAPLRAPEYDAEALEIIRMPTGGLDVLVSFERDHRILRYAGPPETEAKAEVGNPSQKPRVLAALGRRAERLSGWLEDWPGGLPNNGGIEAMAVRDDGAALLLAEDTSTGRFRLSGDAPWSTVKYRNVPSFKPTDAVFLPVEGRHLALVLSRHFSLMNGVAATLELVDLDTVENGALSGQLLARLAPPVSVDNMEALTVVPRGGGWDVYILADNNQNPLQRTLLLKFALPASAVGQSAVGQGATGQGATGL